MESILIANLTHAKGIAVHYRLAPEHTFPAADDLIVACRGAAEDACAGPDCHLRYFGRAVICGKLALTIKALGLPEPDEAYKLMATFFEKHLQRALYRQRTKACRVAALPMKRSWSTISIGSWERRALILRFGRRLEFSFDYAVFVNNSSENAKSPNHSSNAG